MWEGVGDRTELQHIDPQSIGHQYFFPVLPGCSTEAQPLWVLVFSTASFLQLVWSPNTDFLSLPGLYNNLTSTLIPASVTIALIQPVHGQGYNILIFLDRMHLIFTQVHFLFWQLGYIGIPKHKNHLRLLSSGTKLFITFQLKVFDIRRVIHHISMLTFPSAPPPTTTTTRSTRCKASTSSESQPSSSDAKTQLSDFFQIPKILRARFRCMTSFTSPGYNSYLEFLFWYLWMTHPTRAHGAPD